VARIDVPFNPNLGPDDVFNAVSVGFGATDQVKHAPIKIPGVANAIVRRRGVQVAVKLHQRAGKTYLVVNSQPASIIQMVLLGFVFAYFATAKERQQLETEVIDYLTRWLVPVSTPSSVGV